MPKTTYFNASTIADTLCRIIPLYVDKSPVPNPSAYNRFPNTAPVSRVTSCITFGFAVSSANTAFTPVFRTVSISFETAFDDGWSAELNPTTDNTLNPYSFAKY
jgi:hypothetical protein